MRQQQCGLWLRLSGWTCLRSSTSFPAATSITYGNRAAMAGTLFGPNCHWSMKPVLNFLAAIASQHASIFPAPLCAIVMAMQCYHADLSCYNNNNNDRLTAFDPGQPG